MPAFAGYRKPVGECMSDLIVIAFDDAQAAFDLRTRLYAMEKDYLIDMEDAVVVTRDDKGKVKLHQAMNLTATGAVGGSFWGLLIGVLFLNPLLGVAVGAGAGALSGALTDIGVDDKFMKDLGGTLKEGGGAVFVLVRKMTTDKVLDGLKDFTPKGTILRTSLSRDSEEALREAIGSRPTSEG